MEPELVTVSNEEVMKELKLIRRAVTGFTQRVSALEKKLEDKRLEERLDIFWDRFDWLSNKLFNSPLLGDYLMSPNGEIKKSKIGGLADNDH